MTKRDTSDVTDLSVVILMSISVWGSYIGGLKKARTNPPYHLNILLPAFSYVYQHLKYIQPNLPMFALICELPSSPCGWLRLINNNSS